MTGLSITHAAYWIKFEIRGEIYSLYRMQKTGIDGVSFLKEQMKVNQFSANSNIR